MEDKTACYENIDILSSRRLFDLKRTDSDPDSDDEKILRRKRPNALFAVFDGHCGADCAQYVSTHLPLAIVEALTDDAGGPDSIGDMLKKTFRTVNDKFTCKAREEVEC